MKSLFKKVKAALKEMMQEISFKFCSSQFQPNFKNVDLIHEETMLKREFPIHLIS
jgi:hypothetical protein